jgi:hypothetical protein
MKEIGKGFYGKNYDSAFEWTDEKIYCSELIWKIYKRATGIEIGNLEKLGDFDLSNKVVKQKIKERYGEKIPLGELVISPAALFESDKLGVNKKSVAINFVFNAASTTLTDTEIDGMMKKLITAFEKNIQAEIRK